MSASAGQSYRLIVRSGRRWKRRLPLRDKAVRVGRASDCDLVLSDALLSPVHATFEPQGDSWVVSNQGLNGTLVNGEMLRGARSLAPGDRLRLGENSELEFSIYETGGSKREPKERGSRKGPLWTRPSVLVGLGIYIGAIVLAGVWVSRAVADFEPTGLTPALVRDATDATRAFLTSPELGSERQVAVTPDHPAASFQALIAAAKQDGLASTEQANALIKQLDADLFQAWQLQQQGRHDQATKTLRRVMARIPSLSAPTTRFAARVIEQLEGVNYE